MTGLTNEQVQQRIEEGKINVNENPNTRSYKPVSYTHLYYMKDAEAVFIMKVPDGSHERAMLAWADSWKIKKNFFM